MTHGVSVIRGHVHAIDDSGTPDFVESPDFQIRSPTIIMIHGYRFHPWLSRHNPHRKLFPHWREWLGDGAFGFGWDSGGGCLAPARAWFSGRWNSYRYAWDMAERAGGVLAKIIGTSGPCVKIVAHSLGTRVALKALRDLPEGRVSRVLLIAGAERSQRALAVSMYAKTKTLNVACREDGVLHHLGRLMEPEAFISDIIGYHGLRKDSRPEWWTDIWLDDKELQRRMQKEHHLDIKCDDPLRVGDHWHYNNPDNRKLFARWIMDEEFQI